MREGILDDSKVSSWPDAAMVEAMREDLNRFRAKREARVCDTKRDERIDGFLAYLLAEWEAVPQLASEWADWSEDDRLAFALDWPIREDRLMQLDALATEQFSPNQRRGYGRLRKLVAQQRPILDRLFEQAGLPPSGPRGARLPPRR